MFKNVLKNVDTLVVVGKWNIHVFSPDWVKQNLFEGEEMKISVVLPSGPFQFRGNSFELTVSDNRLHFELLSKEDSARIDAIQALRTILRLLGQTPVTAFGINFVYDTDHDLRDYFKSFGQTNNVVGLPFTRIKREVKWSMYDEKSNSTNIRLFEETGKYRVDVNYNYPVTECFQIMEMIDDDSVLANKKADCEQLLKERLNIDIDSQDERI